MITCCVTAGVADIVAGGSEFAAEISAFTTPSTCIGDDVDVAISDDDEELDDDEEEYDDNDDAADVGATAALFLADGGISAFRSFNIAFISLCNPACISATCRK